MPRLSVVGIPRLQAGEDVNDTGLACLATGQFQVFPHQVGRAFMP